MERPRISEEILNLDNRITAKAPSLRVYRWGLAFVLAAGSLILAACERTTVPALATFTPPKPEAGSFVPNKSKTQKSSAASAQPGACAPFATPKWTEYGQLVFRCVDPSSYLSKDVRASIREAQGGAISVEINSPWSLEGGTLLTVPYGQTKEGIPNPVNDKCTLQISNTGQQPQVEQTCEDIEEDIDSLDL